MSEEGKSKVFNVTKIKVVLIFYFTIDLPLIKKQVSGYRKTV